MNWVSQLAGRLINESRAYDNFIHIISEQGVD
jgi:hypothetical protein